MVTDNGVAISTNPDEGRGIKDFKAYAEAFGMRHYACDGRRFLGCLHHDVRGLSYIREAQKPVVMHVHSLPRFNGHSSAADVTFDLGQDDPLCSLALALVERGVLKRRHHAPHRGLWSTFLRTTSWARS